MSKTGQRLIQAAREAASIARGEKKAARLHIPAEIDVRAVRQKMKLSGREEQDIRRRPFAIKIVG